MDCLLAGSLAVWRGDSIPSPAVVRLDVLSPEGVSLRTADGVRSPVSSVVTGSIGSQATGTITGSGSCDACGTATTFRFTLAYHLSEREANFVLENVPVPEF